MDNSDTAQITVCWGPGSTTTFNAREWNVSQTNGVSMLIIQDKESSNVSYDIPLENVLYWTIDVGNDSGLAVEDVPKDRYCDTCKIYFYSAGVGWGLQHTGHEVFYSCCGAPSNALHDSNCSNYVYNEGKSWVVKDGLRGDADLVAKTLDEADRELRTRIENDVPPFISLKTLKSIINNEGPNPKL